jgi:peptide/nickel transport system substrate-binding protein
MEFARFEQYYLGRPPLDTLVVQFVGDATAMVARILAGAVDVVLPTGVDPEVAAEVRRRWEGTGNRVTLSPSGAIQYLLIQHRPEYARPRNGFTNRLVRQAFYCATDRRTVADVATAGQGPPADSWIPPTHELYPQVQQIIPQYPFDLSLAQQRLAQAGWTRTTQSELVHEPGGERFEVEVRAPPGLGGEKMLATIASAWKSVGAQVELNVVPAARAADAEYRVTLPGVTVTGNIWDQFTTGALDSRQTATAANRWAATNRAGYSNPALDALYDRLAVTIAPADRLPVHRAMLEEAMGDVAFIPLFWVSAPVLALKEVRGIRGMWDNSNTWNIFEWSKN